MARQWSSGSRCDRRSLLSVWRETRRRLARWAMDVVGVRSRPVSAVVLSGDGRFSRSQLARLVVQMVCDLNISEICCSVGRRAHIFSVLWQPSLRNATQRMTTHSAVQLNIGERMADHNYMYDSIAAGALIALFTSYVRQWWANVKVNVTCI